MLLDNTLKERTETLTATIGQGAVLFDNTLKQRTETLTATIGQGAHALDKTLKDRTEGLTAIQGAVRSDSRSIEPSSSAKAPCCSTTR